MADLQIYSDSPYYDDYDETKDYVQILAASGNYAQAREFTQQGTIFRDFMARMGNAVFTNGQIISGCSLVISNNKAVLQPGILYVDGLVRKVRETLSVDITGVGTEYIGVKVVEKVITASDDVSLRNPAVGTEGFNMEGASRVQQKLELTVDDESAVSIYQLNNGVIYTEVIQIEDTTTTITDMLAQRTYDVSGNFRVEGFSITNANKEFSSSVYVGAGKAYIHGYKVELQNMKEVECEIPKMVRVVLNEPKTFRNVGTSLILNNRPLSNIESVTTSVKITREMTRGGIQGGYDELPDQPVVSIEKVVAGSKTYVQGTDYQLSGDRIDWSLLGEEPSTGSSYEVTYIYKRDNIEGTDYTLGTVNGYASITFLSSGSVPIENSEVLIDYKYYLSRADTYCIDQNANIIILKGNPDREELCEAPINSDKTTLTIGTVLNYANSSDKFIVNEPSKVLTQSDINNLKKRIDDLEYNQAIESLDNEAKDGEDATELKGILTDGFIGFTKSDVNHKEWDCAIDVDLGEMTVQSEEEVVELNVDTDSADNTSSTIGRVLMAPYREETCLSQGYATTKFLVNPYAVYGKDCLITLNPSVDNWVDKDVITINQSNTKTYSLRRWWYHRGESWAASVKQQWLALTGTTGEQLGWSNYSGTSTSVVDTVKSSAIAYMRQRTVQFNASNFEPYEDNIELYFNGSKITPKTYSAQGATSGTLKANGSGKLNGTFTVPANTPCGSVEVQLKGPISSGSTTYISNGTLQTTTRTVLTTKVIVNTNDPLAQSFQFDRATILMGLDLYFAAKDEKRALTIQVRSMDNGYPGTICYAEEILYPEDISVNGDIPVATHVSFSQPVYCDEDTQYCFVVLSDSNAYQLWIAEMGEVDVKTKKKVTIQPYVGGVMFSSSNGLTWTAHQMADLTFDLYKCVYTGTGIIVFENVSKVEFDRILLVAETEDHKNAGITWYFRVNGEDSWETIETYAEKETSSIGKTFDLKAVLSVAQSTSPMVARDCMNIVLFKNRTKATYVSRQIELEEKYTTLKVTCEFALPVGCTAHVYYMASDVSESWNELTVNSTVQVNEEFVRNTYVKDSLSAKNYRVKVVLETTNPLNRPRARKLCNILKY